VRRDVGPLLANRLEIRTRGGVLRAARWQPHTAKESARNVSIAQRAHAALRPIKCTELSAHAALMRTAKPLSLVMLARHLSQSEKSPAVATTSSVGRTHEKQTHTGKRGESRFIIERTKEANGVLWTSPPKTAFGFGAALARSASRLALCFAFRLAPFMPHAPFRS
jgi:hypothetical protein